MSEPVRYVDIERVSAVMEEAAILRQNAAALVAEAGVYKEPFCGNCGAINVTFYPLGISCYGPWALLCLECEKRISARYNEKQPERSAK